MNHFLKFLLIENLVKEVSKKMKMKKLIKSFQSGLEMLAKSTYGDINLNIQSRKNKTPILWVLKNEILVNLMDI